MGISNKGGEYKVLVIVKSKGWFLGFCRDGKTFFPNTTCLLVFSVKRPAAPLNRQKRFFHDLTLGKWQEESDRNYIFLLAWLRRGCWRWLLDRVVESGRTGVWFILVGCGHSEKFLNGEPIKVCLTFTICLEIPSKYVLPRLSMASLRLDPKPWSLLFGFPVDMYSICLGLP